MELEHSFIETNGIRLHVVQAGLKSGVPVVLLHGFPEFWYGWRKQIPALVEAGCRVIVPDQRGYFRFDCGVLQGIILMKTRSCNYAIIILHLGMTGFDGRGWFRNASRAAPNS